MAMDLSSDEANPPPQRYQHDDTDDDALPPRITDHHPNGITTPEDEDSSGSEAHPFSKPTPNGAPTAGAADSSSDDEEYRTRVQTRRAPPEPDSSSSDDDAHPNHRQITSPIKSESDTDEKAATQYTKRAPPPLESQSGSDSNPFVNKPTKQEAGGDGKDDEDGAHSHHSAETNNAEETERKQPLQAPNQPLSDQTDFAAMCPSYLRKELIDACDKLNWTRPSKIQYQAIKGALPPDGSYNNLIGQARHGSGKTGAFVLCMLQRIDPSLAKLQAMVVTHSRELANQTYQVTTTLGAFMDNLSVGRVVARGRDGGRWIHQVCIGTPGSIIDRVLNRHTRTRGGLEVFLSHFKVFVVDEADDFLKDELSARHRYTRSSRPDQSSFGTLYDQLCMIIKDLEEFGPKVNNAAVATFQRMLFSATFPNTIKKLSVKLAPGAVVIRVKRKLLQLSNVKIVTIRCRDDQDKFDTMMNVVGLCSVGQMIVFCNTVSMVKELVAGLESHNMACSLLVGGLEAADRDRTMEQFRKGQTPVLVASNVIARGIDVPAVRLVVNFEIPMMRGHSVETGELGFTFDSETFMHRVGRTGRFGTKGVCLNLVSDVDVRAVECLESIKKEYSLQTSYCDKSLKAITEHVGAFLGTGVGGVLDDEL